MISGTEYLRNIREAIRFFDDDDGRRFCAQPRQTEEQWLPFGFCQKIHNLYWSIEETEGAGGIN
jgi:hypothetical protein